MKTTYNSLTAIIALFIAGCSSFHAVYTSPFNRDKEKTEMVIVPDDACVSDCAIPINYGDNPPPKHIKIDDIRKSQPTEKPVVKAASENPKPKKKKPAPPAERVPEGEKNDSRPPRHYEELQYASAASFFEGVWRVFI